MTSVGLIRRLVREAAHHVDESIGAAVGEALAKRLTNRRTISSIVDKLADRDDLYTPADRSGLTQDTVRRTADVVMNALRPVVEQLVEQAIRDVMIRWQRW
jgi:hypothetical protein